ncbi:hypothetical protein PM082_009152 [Marasmius tenuissimus]|nr:hypothetical protein PM082_009152 [Marasmius tenuissimus]
MAFPQEPGSKEVVHPVPWYVEKPLTLESQSQSQRWQALPMPPSSSTTTTSIPNQLELSPSSFLGGVDLEYNMEFNEEMDWPYSDVDSDESMDLELDSEMELEHYGDDVEAPGGDTDGDKEN